MFAVVNRLCCVWELVFASTKSREKQNIYYVTQWIILMYDNPTSYTTTNVCTLRQLTAPTSRRVFAECIPGPQYDQTCSELSFHITHSILIHLKSQFSKHVVDILNIFLVLGLHPSRYDFYIILNIIVTPFFMFLASLPPASLGTTLEPFKNQFVFILPLPCSSTPKTFNIWSRSSPSSHLRNINYNIIVPFWMFSPCHSWFLQEILSPNIQKSRWIISRTCARFIFNIFCLTLCFSIRETFWIFSLCSSFYHFANFVNNI